MRTHRIRTRETIRAPPLRSADFQVGCIADFQIRERGIVQVGLDYWCVADLEIGDTAALESCATRTLCADAPLVYRAGKKNFHLTTAFRMDERGSQPT